MKHISHILSFGQPDCVFRTHIHNNINKCVTKKYYIGYRNSHPINTINQNSLNEISQIPGAHSTCAKLCNTVLAWHVYIICI